jgi:hypothetical protein
MDEEDLLMMSILGINFNYYFPKNFNGATPYDLKEGESYVIIPPENGISPEDIYEF